MGQYESQIETEVLALERAAAALSLRVGNLDRWRVPAAEQGLSQLWGGAAQVSTVTNPRICGGLPVPNILGLLDSVYGTTQLIWDPNYSLSPAILPGAWVGCKIVNRPNAGITCLPAWTTTAITYVFLNDSSDNPSTMRLAVKYDATVLGCPIDGADCSATMGTTYAYPIGTPVCSPFSWAPDPGNRITGDGTLYPGGAVDVTVAPP